MGTAAGICGILGWFTCGLLCPIGLVLGLCSMGKEPKGMAITGVIVGGLGSLLSLILLLFFGGTLFVACAGCIGLSNMAAEIAQQRAASQPAAQAIIDYYKENEELPDAATASTLIAPFEHNGEGFRYNANADNISFIIEHPGPDAVWDTEDDWQTSWNARLSPEEQIDDIDTEGDPTPDESPEPY